MKFNEYLNSLNSDLNESATIDSALKQIRAFLKKQKVEISQFGATDTDANFTLKTSERFLVHMFIDVKTGKVRNAKFEKGSVPEGGSWNNWQDLVTQFQVSGDAYIRLASAMQAMSSLFKQVSTVDDPQQALALIVDKLA